MKLKLTERLLARTAAGAAGSKRKQPPKDRPKPIPKVRARKTITPATQKKIDALEEELEGVLRQIRPLIAKRQKLNDRLDKLKGSIRAGGKK